MADFYATSRSNYIKVKDMEKATASLAPFGNTIHIHTTHPEYFVSDSALKDGAWVALPA